MPNYFTPTPPTDIVFFVVHNSTKTRFKAHRNILSFRAPSFLSLVEDVDPDEDVPIECVDPAVFRAILYFIYSDELPKDLSLKENGDTRRSSSSSLYAPSLPMHSSQ